jgi:lysine 2,3-aminomutase
MVGTQLCHMSTNHMEQALAYVARTPQVRDVLISGGDPFLLVNKRLESLLRALRAIPHVEIIRIGTRTPVFLPQRINAALVSMLRRHQPLYVNIHVNHPLEVTDEMAAACGRLADAGIPLGSQTVLLAGINDCPNIMRTLMRRLLQVRVRPYYIYQCDLSDGIGHFRTSVQTGIEILEGLRGHTSGLAVPTFVIDAPGGGGKIPVAPQYVLSKGQERVILRNYCGHVAVYPQPATYASHRPEQCAYCRTTNGDARGTAEPCAPAVVTIPEKAAVR